MVLVVPKCPSSPDRKSDTDFTSIADIITSRAAGDAASVTLEE